MKLAFAMGALALGLAGCPEHTAERLEISTRHAEVAQVENAGRHRPAPRPPRAPRLRLPLR